MEIVHVASVFSAKSLTRSYKTYKNTEPPQCPTEEQPTVIHPIKQNVASHESPILIEII